MFTKPATSPAKNGDAMSTTPDTSPQATKDSDRYGPFASANAKSMPALTNGTSQGGSGSNLFGFSSNMSTDQPSNAPTIEGGMNGRSAHAGSQGSEARASDISLGSPTKSRRIAQPTFGQPHIEQEQTPAKSPFPGFNWSSAPASTAPPPSTSPQKQSVAGAETNGSASSLLANTATHSTVATGPSPRREPGMPPPAPDDFTKEQNLELITGYRLKQLDRGLQSYLEYSSWSKDEIESISAFYELRKDAVLDANGGPVKEIVSNKRAAETNESPNKKARHQAPTAATEQTNPFAGMASTGQSNPSKRKADEDLSKDTNQTNVNGLKRSKADDQITYPSLPESSSSQTSKLFGNLVGTQTQDGSSSTGDPAANRHLSNGVIPNEVDTSSKPQQPQSSLFFQPPKFNGASEPKSTVANESHTALFNFPAKVAPKPLQSTSGNDSIFSQTPNSHGVNPPFKGFFPSQSNSGSSNTPASSNSFAMPSNAQSSNTSSPFSHLNGGTAAQANSKRKADAFESKENAEERSSPAESDDQRAKKPRTSEESTSTPQATTERAGFGDSILSRPGAKAVNTSNIFGHLSNSTSENDEDDEDGDHEPEDTRGGTKQTDASGPGNAPSTSGKSNAAGSSVFNPFASASFKPAQGSAAGDKPVGSSVFNPFAKASFKPTGQPPNEEKPAGSSVYNPFASATVPPTQKPADGEKSEGRSFFDRIEKDDKGQPVKAPKSLDFGQSILKTPKAGSGSGQTTQATGSIFGSFGTGSTNASPSSTSAFNMFGKPSTSDSASTAGTSSTTGSGGSPAADNTWKAGTPVKFAPSTGAPSFNVTSPSPTKAPLTGLFGAPKTSTTSEMPGSPAKPAPLTFAISAPPKDSNESLAPPSGTQSESTSRATSPGAPSSENGNDASDEVHEEQTHPELDTAEANKAEADEDTIFEAAAKVHELAPYKTRNPETGKEETGHKWVVRGHEQFRVLKHRETKQTRMLMKLKVNGRVILNAALQKSLTYKLATPKQVRVPVPSNGKIDTWQVQVGKEVDAKRLVDVLEENKAN